MNLASSLKTGLQAKVENDHKQSLALREMQLRQQQQAAGRLGGGGYEGVLFKKPTKLSAYLSWSGWRRRYCVVDDDGFRYYGRQGDTEPRGEVEFDGACRVVRLGKVDHGLYGFDLIAREKRQPGLIFSLEATSNGARPHPTVEDGRRMSSAAADDDEGLIVHSFASGDERAIAIWADVLELKIRQASLRKKHPLRRRSSKIGSSSLRSNSIALEVDEDEEEVDSSEPADENGDLPGVASTAGTISRELIGKVPNQWVHFKVASANQSSCWKTVEMKRGSLVSFKEPSFAGNSSTDLGAWIDTFWGNHDIKSSITLQAPAAELFAAVMDLSTCRSNWDDSFVEGKVIRVLDHHNDAIVLRFKTSKGTAPRMATMRRYWARSAGGAYTVFCFSDPSLAEDGQDQDPATSKGKKKKIKGTVECEIAAYQITLAPVGSRSSLKQYTNVTHRVIFGQVGGWARYLPSAAKQLAIDLVSEVSNLSRLFSGSTAFPFEGRLLSGIRAANVRFEDSVALVNLLRDISAATSRAALEDLRKDLPEAIDAAAAPDTSGLKSRSRKAPKKAKGGTAPMNRKYAVPKNNYILPKEISKDGTSMWWDSGVDEGYWNLRGPNYLADRVKIPSAVSAMEMVQMQWSFYDEPKRNIAKHEDELVQLEHEGRPDRPFMLIINFMVPTIGNWVCYFLKRESVSDPVFDRMFKSFIEEDDEYRNSRFKIIPSVVDGSYFAKKGIGNTPAILGKKIKCEYYHGSNWFEVCVDVGSSRVAGSLMSLVKSYAATLVIDLAFLIESQSVDELPERLIGGARMYKPLMYPVEDVAAYAKGPEVYEKAVAIQPYVPPADEPAGTGESEAEEVEEAPKSPPPEVASHESSIDAAQVEKPDVARPAPVENAPAGKPRRKSVTDDPPQSRKHHAKPKPKPHVLATKVSMASLNYKYETGQNDFLIHKGKAKMGQSCWSDSGTVKGLWNVRGATYFTDNRKIPSAEATMELVQCQWSFFDEPKRHIASDPDELVQLQSASDAGNRPFLIVVNFMVPLLGNWVLYFAKRRNYPDQEIMERFERDLDRFVELDDSYRNGKFKLIPSVVEGYFVAKKAIGTKPVIIGNHLAVDYFRGQNYFEICVDTSKSRLATDLFGVVRSYASSLVVDVGFTLEAHEEDELPEILLGGCRIFKPITFPMTDEEFQRQYVKQGRRKSS